MHYGGLNMENDGLIYTLIDDDGIEQEFEYLDQLEFEGNVYYAMSMLSDADDDEELAEFDVLRVESDEDGEEILVTLEDDDLRTRIGDMFVELLNAED
jgi:uncharacterized protein YrzB (UPF0473 family)